MAIMYRADSIIPQEIVPSDLEAAGEDNSEEDGKQQDIKGNDDDVAATPTLESRLANHSYEEKLKSLDAHGWTLASFAFQALGVVYGDIGTSPLYVLNGIFPSDGPAPDKEDVIGVISVIV